MKKLILMIMLINIVAVSQSLYDAQIVLDDLYWHNPEHEWGCHMHGELYLNGILQQPSQDYYYSWQWQIDGQWVERPTSGYGQYNIYIILTVLVNTYLD